jgi:hypothetical protein
VASFDTNDRWQYDLLKSPKFAVGDTENLPLIGKISKELRFKRKNPANFLKVRGVYKAGEQGLEP